MKRTMIATMIALTFASVAASAGELTPAQRAEQRRQQESAKRAYQESAKSHDEAAAGWKKAQVTSKKVLDKSIDAGINVLANGASR